MNSLQALKEYRDTIYELCSNLKPETMEFFQMMEERSINILNDTKENQIENYHFIDDYFNCISNIEKYLNLNPPLKYYEKYCKALPKALILTPQQVFETLVARSRKTQEEVVNLSCEQYLMSRILKTLEDNNLTEFTALVEEHKVDMSDVSKLLSLTDIPQYSEWNSDTLELWNEFQKEKFKEIDKSLFHHTQSNQPVICNSPSYKWVYGSNTNVEVKKDNPIDLNYERANRIKNLTVVTPEDFNSVLLDVLFICGGIHMRSIIIEITKLPNYIANKIRDTLSPFYFRPLIEKYEREWEEVQREQKRFISSLQSSSDTQSEDFSLPDDFFTKKIDSSSIHMNIHPEVVKAGVKKFEELLLALAEEGYVSKKDLPLLAYRLTGRGTPFGEETLTWYKEPKVIRYIIATLHAPGSYWVSKLNKYFVDENGHTFLDTIEAGQARNIKTLPIYKQIIKPYYGEVSKKI